MKKLKLIILLLVIGVVAYFPISNARANSKKQALYTLVDRKIKSANLLHGTPQQVMGFLDKERIPHSTYAREALLEPRTVVAMIDSVAEVYDPIPTVYDLRIVFQFDEKNRLQEYSLSWFAVSL